MGRHCFVPKCKSGYKSCRNKLSLFKAPKDEDKLSKWRQAISRSDRELTERDQVCELHFEPHFIKREWIHEHNGNIVQRVRYTNPKLDKNAIPTLFPGCPGYSSKSILKPARKPPPLQTAVTPSNDYSPMQRSIVVVAPSLDEERAPSIASKCLAASNNELENRPNDCSVEIKLEPEDNNDVGECVNTSSADVDQTLTYAKVLNSLALPTMAWGIHELNHLGLKTICITELIETDDQRLASLKKICVDESMHCKVYILDNSVELGVFDVNDAPRTLRDLQVLINNVHDKVLCTGGPGGVKHKGIHPQAAYVDVGGVWRHKQCQLFAESNVPKRCSLCLRLNHVLSRHAKRQEERRECQRVKIAKLRRRSRLKTKAISRLSTRLKVCSEKLHDEQQKMANIEDETLQENLDALNLPPAQMILINECVAAGKLTSKRACRYSEEWLLMCLLLHRRSPSTYQYLREHEIMPLPSTKTIRKYLGIVDVKSGFDKAFFVALGEKLSAKSELQGGIGTKGFLQEFMTTLGCQENPKP